MAMLNRITRLCRRSIIVAIGGLALSALVVPNTASAAPKALSCYIVCDGQNPDTAVYEDEYGNLRPCDKKTIYTHAPAGGGGASVSLRYSSKCRMAWARGGVYGIVIQGFNADGSFRTSYDAHNPSGTAFTMAVNDAGLTARACIFIPSSGGNISCGPRY
jgi:hypothetical protein